MHTRGIGLLTLTLLIGLVAPAQRVLIREEMIKAEEGFAALAISDGIPAAFLANCDTAGIVFNGTNPVRASDVYKEQKRDTNQHLYWKPKYGKVVGEGTIGISSGPYVFVIGASDTVARGHFFSIWHRDPSGAYKVLLDGGVSDTSVNRSTFTGDANATSTTSETPASSNNADFQEAIASFQTAVIKDPVSAYTSLLAGNCYVLRTQHHPALTRESALNTIESFAAITHYTKTETRLQAGNQSAYVFGSCQAHNGQQGYFVQVWQRVGNTWMIIADVLEFPQQAH